MSVFEKALSAIEPEAVRTMILAKLDETASLIETNNADVNSVLLAKASDPNSAEFQDLTWKDVVSKETDPEIKAWAKKYYAALETAEELLSTLRAKAVDKHIQAPMSDTDVQKTKARINAGKSLIETSRIGAAAYAEMADQMLGLIGKPVEGGVISLLPNQESLMNTRGKAKGSAGKSDEKPYATRIIDATIDGVSTNRVQKSRDRVTKTTKSHWNNIATDLNKAWNVARFPQNEVTALEIEEAFYASHKDESGTEIAFRDNKSMPLIHAFEFSREIQVQNPNDNESKGLPQTVVIEITQPGAATDNNDTNTENIEATDNDTENAENEENTDTQTANEDDAE